MSGPNDHDFDEDGRLRDISESWSQHVEECSRVLPATGDDHDDDE